VPLKEISIIIIAVLQINPDFKYFRGMKKRIKSFEYALNGLKIFFKTQPNAQIHLFASVFIIILGIIYKLENQEWLLIIFAIGIVFLAEAFNTAIEFLVNFVSPDFHKEAGKIKDLAAAGVLIAAITAAVIAILIFLPKII
jgi:diacylglycerol kinase